MATIKTIKPGGGGDYTTLAAWNTFAAAQATSDQWAECYTGNLGSVQLDNWTSTPSSTVYAKIYSAPGHRHNGISPTSGAHIASADDIGLVIYHAGLNYMRVEGIAVQIADASWSACFVMANRENVLFDGCLAVGHGLDDDSAGFGSYMQSTGNSVTYRNCIARDFADDDDVSLGSGFYIQNSGGQGGYTATMENCTVYNCNTPYLIAAAP